jgi:putative DNA-invertase from lambdoid prophage Rac
MNAETSTKCALFLRVSTEDQNLDNQRLQLEQMAAARGLVIAGVYEEKVSGAAAVRPAFERMMEDAHRGGWKYLLCVSLDRLGRSMMRTVSSVLTLDRAGVVVISLREPWLDSGAPGVRDLLLCVFAWVASEERRVLALRTKAGLARCKAKGIKLGRPPVRVDVARAVALRDGGMSIREIASELKVKPSTLHRALQAAGPFQKGGAKR